MDRRDTSLINCFVENRSPETDYIFDFISDVLGIAFNFVQTTTEADLCYGTGEITDKLSIKQAPNDTIWHELLNNAVSTSHKHLDFDIIQALFNFISDKVNSTDKTRELDRHDRLKFTASFQYHEKIHQFPIVNVYILFLKEWFKTNLNIVSLPLYPKGKKACIILSHDVDNPGKYDDIKFYKLLPKKISPVAIIKHYRYFFGTLKNKILDQHKNENWNFENIVRKEKEKGFKSTYFFATVNWQSKSGHHFDVPYILSSKYKKVISFLLQQGQSVGLHASYNAWQKAENFRTEKAHLTKVSGSVINGLRHHYWHLGENTEQTLLWHEQSEFKYDSSLAFNDHIGFRYNTALPFFPYNSHLKRKVNVLQIPMFCMDGNFFRNKNVTIEEALSEIKKYIFEIKKNNGVGAVDWHVNTSYPGGPTFKKWGNAYLELLDYLEKDTEIWVTDCADFEDWWNNKRKLTGHEK